MLDILSRKEKLKSRSTRLGKISGDCKTCPEIFEELSNGKETEFFFAISECRTRIKKEVTGRK